MGGLSKRCFFILIVMKYKTLRENFRVNYAHACGRDETRPVMQHVYFKDGNVIATESHILIVCPLSYHNVPNPEALEGKFIHHSVFNKIFKYHKIYPNDEGIVCYNKDGIKEAMFYYADDMKYPNYQHEINMAKRYKENTNNMKNFNFLLLNKIKKVMLSDTPLFYIDSREYNYNLITSKHYPNQLCIFMGAMLEE